VISSPIEEYPAFKPITPHRWVSFPVSNAKSFVILLSFFLYNSIGREVNHNPILKNCLAKQHGKKAELSIK